MLEYIITKFSLFSAFATMMEGANAARGDDQPASLFGQTGILTEVSTILLFVIGALSVIMIIIAGLRYVTSGGNTAAITAAKNTLLYAVIGIIVALLAYAVIRFVIGAFANEGGVAGL